MTWAEVNTLNKIKKQISTYYFNKLPSNVFIKAEKPENSLFFSTIIMNEISKVNVSLQFAFTGGEQHSETDMQMNNLTITSYIHTCEKQKSSLRANNHVFYLMYRLKRETWIKPPMVDEEVDRHPLCSAAVFLKILHCPLMFISMTFVQLQHAAGSLSSTRSVGGRLPEKRDMQTPHFTGFHTNSWCIWCAWVRKHFLSAGTMCRHPPSSPVSIPNIQHPLSSLLPSLPRLWFTSSFTASLTFYGDDIYTCFFFPLCAFSPCLKCTEAQQVERYPTKHFIYYATDFL